MPTEFKLPELGENVEKGDVVRVMVAAGDTIKLDQPVLELETDKATIEVPSTVAGKVTEIRVKAGEKVKVGQVVLVVDSAAATAPASSEVERPAAAPSAVERASAPVPEPVRVPAKIADVVNITSARPAPAAAPSRLEMPAPSRIDAGGHPSTSLGVTSAAPSEAAASVPAAPSVRRFARELGVDIVEVVGTGPGGRIGPEDVKQHVKTMLANGGGAVARTAPLPDFSKWGEVEVKPMSNIRRKTAEHLTQAWQAPHVTQHDRADITALEEFRHTFGPRVEKAGGKLTVTAVLIKVLASALDRFPQFASSPDMANQAIVYKKYRHIGVAVDTPNGLLVPVIRDANRKTITEIAAELAGLSQKARDKKLTLDEMSGSVFSVTNLGGIGGTAFTPIINQPEVAILGVSRGSHEPVWVPSSSEFVARQMLPLSLSYDHRVIDGADAARFLRFVAEALEQPLTMSL